MSPQSQSLRAPRCDGSCAPDSQLKPRAAHAKNTGTRSTPPSSRFLWSARAQRALHVARLHAVCRLAKLLPPVTVLPKEIASTLTQLATSEPLRWVARLVSQHGPGEADNALDARENRRDGTGKYPIRESGRTAQLNGAAHYGFNVLLHLRARGRLTYAQARPASHGPSRRAVRQRRVGWS